MCFLGRNVPSNIARLILTFMIGFLYVKSNIQKLIGGNAIKPIKFETIATNSSTTKEGYICSFFFCSSSHCLFVKRTLYIRVHQVIFHLKKSCDIANSS